MTAFSGFNAFGQLSFVHEGKMHKLQDLGLKFVAPSWSYTVFASSNWIILKGLLGKKPNEIKEFKTDAGISFISSCDSFCLILLENGCLLKLKPTSNATLEEIKFALITNEVPRKRKIFGERVVDPIKITHVSCGNTISVAISDKNMVYNIPNPTHQLPKHLRVQQLQCGFEHAVLLSGNGDVYSWGHGLRGQLGHDILRLEEEPTIIDALAGMKITYIAAGGWHSAAVSAFGDLYTWGYNSNGQLGIRIFNTQDRGLKAPVVYPLPQLIDISACCVNENFEYTDDTAGQCKPEKVFAGARHTILQMSCGSLFATGWNKHGQLCLHDKSTWKDIFKQTHFEKEKVLDSSVVCGPWCTIILQRNKYATR